ncbi:MAG: hypothetical protein KC931_25940, partial [Candidatus Omnitrophica bacterium]|nr:hypothetical protein [Candidatus Omnitrophota bacterium]
MANPSLPKRPNLTHISRMGVCLLFPVLIVIYGVLGGLGVATGVGPHSTLFFRVGLMGFLILTLQTVCLLFVGSLDLLLLSLTTLVLFLPLSFLFFRRASRIKPSPICHNNVTRAEQRFLRFSIAVTAAVFAHTLLGSLTPEVRSDPL